MPPQADDMTEKKPVKCANCRRDASEAYRPFCSRRCADVDLGRWLTGSYAIAGDTDTDGVGDAFREAPDSEPSGGTNG